MLKIELNETEVARFLSKVDKRGENECWEWKASKNREGYGKFKLRGEDVRAHRVAFFIANGGIDDALLVCHECDNPPCCNPNHLFQGDDAKNRIDCKIKGRTASGERNGQHTHPERTARGDRAGLRIHPESAARGERNGHATQPEKTKRGEDHYAAKLSDSQVEEIRLLRKQGVLAKFIAPRFNISEAHVYNVASGKTWRHRP